MTKDEKLALLKLPLEEKRRVGDWVLCGGCFRSGGGCSAVLAGLVDEAWRDFERAAEKGEVK